MTNAITLSGVGKRYRMYRNNRARLRQLLSFGTGRHFSDFWAVRGVDLDIRRGVTTAVIGVNGSGKSTLLKLMCGITQPTEGKVAIDGRVSTLLDLGAGFNPEFTGVENVYMNGALMGFKKKEMDERLPEIKKFADIGDFMDRPVKTYSSGMFVRLAFACAITVEPDILLVDEVLAVGDAKFQQKCYAKIKSFQDAGKTIVMVTHDMDAVLRHSQHAVVLDKGGLIFQGPPKDAVDRYRLGTWEQAGAQGEPGASLSGAGARPDDGGDGCVKEPAYNPAESRYGAGKARIVNFKMLDGEGLESSCVASGETVRFRFEVLFDERVERPIYGFMVKTVHGVVLYGTNTWHAGVKAGPKGAGERAVVEFSQKAGLASGDYFLSAGVSELDGGDVVPLDRRFDLAMLKVLPKDNSFGLMNLFSEIKVDEKQPQARP